jgi:hypothetical protein
MAYIHVLFYFMLYYVILYYVVLYIYKMVSFENKNGNNCKYSTFLYNFFRGLVSRRYNIKHVKILMIKALVGRRPVTLCNSLLSVDFFYLKTVVSRGE